ncbi:MAG: flippase-like domain-containing protein [Acidobacteriota bacterium]|nr:flippase-like domain-containing protein [Acidobacteriota bacterium]
MDDASSPRRRALWTWILPTALAAALLYYALRGVDWRRVWSTIAAARWQWIVLAALTTCASSLLRALRWRVLLNAAARFDVLTVFWATMAGYLGNAFLPARAGELVRTFVISSRSTLSRAYVLTTALSERMMDAIALVLWSGVVLMGVHPKPAWLEALSRTLAIGAGAGALAVAVLPHTGGLCEAAIRRIPLPAGIRPHLLHLAEQILLGLKVFHALRRFLAFTGFTLVIWCLDASGAILAARGLGLNVNFAVASLLICGMGLGSALPSTPGYVGIYQFVAVSVLTPFGIPRDGALALVLVLQAIGYVVVTAFGVPGLYRFKGWRGAASG